MSGTGQQDKRAEARAAFARSDWAAARSAFLASGELSNEDAETVGYCTLMETGVTEPIEDMVDRYERAGRPVDAARLCLEVARFTTGRGQIPVAMGWVRRAGRLVETEPEGSAHAHLAVHEAFTAYLGGRLSSALEIAERAHALARKYEDKDAEALALNRRGRLLLRLGRIDEGQADLDEAMLLVRRGQLRPTTEAIIYCSTIDACVDMGDYERALQWTEAAAAWLERRNACTFPGICWVHRAELHRLRGDLDGARAQAQAALEMFERFGFRIDAAIATVELGMQYLEAGELDRAEAAFAVVSEISSMAGVGQAMLHLRRGRAAAAREILEHALDEAREDPLKRARMQPTYIEACLAMGNVNVAADALADLERTASTFGTVGLKAAASTAAARVHLHRREPAKALRAARAAAREWATIGAHTELKRAKELVHAAFMLADQSSRGRIEGALIDQCARTVAAAATDDALEAARTVASLADGVPAPLRSQQRIGEGTRLGQNITVERLIGAGGMGVVFAGRHEVTGRDVAIKVLHHALCRSEPACARFLREAQACGRIKHPNVVDIYDAGEHGREPYIVMELLTGESLADLLARERQLPIVRALQIIEDAARGVAAAHAANVVHRDLKPGNIFLCAVSGEGTVAKVLDFGLSKLSDASHSHTDALLGTPLYMAPEQVRAPYTTNELTDIYGLGATLFELLAGRPPYLADDLPSVLQAIATGPSAQLGRLRADVPAAVADLTHRAMARAPEDRFGSAAELADALANARSLA